MDVFLMKKGGEKFTFLETLQKKEGSEKSIFRTFLKKEGDKTETARLSRG